MTLLHPYRVKQTSTTAGTGTYDLIAPAANLRDFVTQFGTGAKIMYCAQDATGYEIGFGTITDAAPDTLSRDNVFLSSNGGAAVNWAAGTRDIFAVMLPNGVPIRDFSAAETVDYDECGILLRYTGTGGHTLSLNAVANYPPGFLFEVWHNGSGNLTIDPNAAEQIDGGSTIVMTAGERTQVFKQGSAWFTGQDTRVPSMVVGSPTGGHKGASSINVANGIYDNNVRVYGDRVPTLAAEQATTSGTSKDFLNIPSWVTKIEVNFVGVSTNGTSNLLVQLGDSGGIEPSGYLGAGGAVLTSSATTVANYTTGFGINVTAVASVVHGTLTLTLEDASDFTWVASGSFGRSDTTQVQITGGSKSLSAALDRVRITTVNGTDAFDAGAINIRMS